jgi:hypothetical protein
MCWPQEIGLPSRRRAAAGAERDPAMLERDIARGYYTDVEAVRLFSRAIAAE